MTVPVRIRIEDKKVRDGLGYFLTDVPKMTDKEAYDVAKLFSDILVRNIQSKNLMWTENLLNHAKRIQKISSSKGAGYEIPLPEYAHYIDKMSPHWVATYKHRELYSWMQDNMPFFVPYLYVRPHPFMRSSWQEAARNIRNYHKKGGSIREYMKKNFG